MALDGEQYAKLIYEPLPGTRFTQDSPVMPDVWVAYAQSEKPVGLLLTPHTGATPGELAAALYKSLSEEALAAARVAKSDTYVVADLTLEDLVASALPLTLWWHEEILGATREPSDQRFLRDGLEDAGTNKLAPQLEWLIVVIRRIFMARIVAAEREKAKQEGKDEYEIEKAIEKAIEEAKPRIEKAVVELLATGAGAPVETKDETWKPLLWQVSRNRPVKVALSASRLAVKADAAVQLFNIECRSITWAVIDCGIDASHPGLCARDDDGVLKPAFEPPESRTLKNSRVVRTYDFTNLRDHVAPGGPATGEQRGQLQDLQQGLTSGRSIDWGELEPDLRVSHDSYKPPETKLEHGTHVAGILSADWRTSDKDMPERTSLIGIAPGLQLYDMRVIGEKDGEPVGDEYSVIAALQFIRWLNGYKDKPVIHGVNLSLSIDHDFRNYACGKTPVCQECERLAATGVVVVAAAGNEGFTEYRTLQGASDLGFRSVSITDPGNAEAVITVGGTHRSQPFSYGVSYFSSRGPTGDGRYKPDLVAPAEKITSLVPTSGAKSLDGTSMAAPHVSGAAALLLARTEELVGDPVRVKKILCESATDLGRERYFQGAGMLDVLRALQLV
jgi:serine protease AprX